MTNTGTIELFSGTLNVDGTLTNDGTIKIGLDIPVDSQVSAAEIVNDGTIDLDAQNVIHATLSSTGPITDDGAIALSNGASLTTTGALSIVGGTLTNDGTVQIGSTSPSPSAGSTVKANGLNLINRANMTTSGALTNSTTIALDGGSGDGGSSLTIGGTLTNGGTIRIGPDDFTLSAASAIKAASLANQVGATLGTISLYGSSTAEATLDVGSAAGFGAVGTLYGKVNLYGGDALIEFASGQITTIAAGGDLLLFGSHAYLADASDTSDNSALAGLKTVDGFLVLHNGASVTTTGAVSNSGTIALDRLSHDGGSSLAIGGTLTNDGTIQIGPSDGTLSAASAMKAASVVNNGTINLHGNGAIRATLSSTGPINDDGAIALSNGASLTTTGALSIVGGTLTNDGTVQIGSTSPSPSAGSTVTANGLESRQSREHDDIGRLYQ